MVARPRRPRQPQQLRPQARDRTQRRVAIGVDIGATNTKAVLATADGTVLDRLHLPTRLGGAEAMLAGVDESVARLRERLDATGVPDLAALGLASGGRYSQADGTVVFATGALPGWLGTPVRDMLTHRYGLPSWVDNDGNAAALAEWTCGAGQGSDIFVGLTLGTGLGGGVLIGGRLVQGVRGNAGEFGHLTIDEQGRPCSCGGRGCWERYVSSVALVEAVEDAIREGRATRPMEELRATATLTARSIGQAARQGDTCALSAIAELGRWLGVGLRNVINVLDPDLVTLAGGLAELDNLLVAPALDELARQRVPVPRIARARLDIWAGAVGAALGGLSLVASP